MTLVSCVRRIHCQIRAVTFVLKQDNACFFSSQSSNPTRVSIQIDKRSIPEHSGIRAVTFGSKWISKGKCCRFIKYIFMVFFVARQIPAPPPHSSRPGPSHYRDFTVKIRHIIFGRIPLEEWSPRPQKYLPDNTHNTHHRNLYYPAGFEPEIPASKRSETQRPLGSTHPNI
jgi:hypothetical protein